MNLCKIEGMFGFCLVAGAALLLQIGDANRLLATAANANEPQALSCDAFQEQQVAVDTMQHIYDEPRGNLIYDEAISDAMGEDNYKFVEWDDTIFRTCIRDDWSQVRVSRAHVTPTPDYPIIEDDIGWIQNVHLYPVRFGKNDKPMLKPTTDLKERCIQEWTWGNSPLPYTRNSHQFAWAFKLLPTIAIRDLYLRCIVSDDSASVVQVPMMAENAKDYIPKRLFASPPVPIDTTDGKALKVLLDL